MRGDPYPSLSSDQIGEAIRAFRAENCPACGVQKDMLSDPFCVDCFGRLTAELKADIVEPGRFIITFHPAMQHLAATRPVRARRSGGKRGQQRSSAA